MPETADESGERLVRAEQKLDEAGQLLEAGFAEAAAHAAYYAAYHAAVALLEREGVRPRTHRGVLVEVRHRLVRTGKLPRETASLLESALDSRLRADYGLPIPLSEEEASETVAAARQFVGVARKLLRG